MSLLIATAILGLAFPVLGQVGGGVGKKLGNIGNNPSTTIMQKIALPPGEG